MPQKPSCRARRSADHPSQWDPTTGQYLYLRYRQGEGTVEQHPSEGVTPWDDEVRTTPPIAPNS
ncbi:hypothetical protein HUT16_34560 [Kitasatospora sp. NA04385]|uniref:hypothetical protein n=1 Tax=Kitasatospora sp. NA04385 TaxID=2742135 RepID=UPI00158FD963|nr:hypothetical protein [Kitasatospora sp. NA04385]QKW17662.1 hypothetical protein HUT16_34560 [Kitasatospora sp. NA04385]